jgi:hypothetical protein
MKNTADFLQNLVYCPGYLKDTIEEGVAALKPYVKDLEVIHVRLDCPDPSTWRKKKYFHISKYTACSKIDEWIFRYLIDQKEYAGYLDKYRPLKDNNNIQDIDEYIMDTHYRPQAIKILSRKKSFNLEQWAKKRVCLRYRRRSNMYWKNGNEYTFNSVIESLFIRKNGTDKEVIGIGGYSGSSSRQVCTFFTAVFYLLGKKTRIPNFLLRYNGLNEFEYIGRRYRTVLTPGFGSNFELSRHLDREIRKKGLYL